MSVQPKLHRSRKVAAKPELTLKLRRATEDDLDTLVDHRRRMWADIGRFTTKERRAEGPIYRRWAKREMRAGQLYALIVETDAGVVAGSGGLWLQPSIPRPRRLRRLLSPYVLSMYTVPRFRNHGVASLIIKEMIEWCKARNYARLTLHASDKGRPVYAKQGFVQGREMIVNLR